MVSIIIEGGILCIHGRHHHLGGIECEAMGAIIIEGGHSVWGLDGVAMTNYRRRGEHARSNHWINDKQSEEISKKLNI